MKSKMIAVVMILATLPICRLSGEETPKPILCRGNYHSEADFVGR